MAVSNTVTMITDNNSGDYLTVKNDKDFYEHDERVRDSEHKHDLAIKEKNLGLLGKFFGADENSSKNITFVMILIILVIAIILTYFCPPNGCEYNFIAKIWENVFPIVTLSLGYIFGKK